MTGINMAMLKRLLKEPLLHFLGLGGLIFIFYGVVDDTPAISNDQIVIGPERIKQMQGEFEAVWKRAPSDDEVDALIDADIRDAVFYRKALALGLDKNDVVIRRRMRQKMEFLLDNGAALLKPATGELEAFFDANKTSYQKVPRLAFKQVFLGPAPDSDTISQILRSLNDSYPTIPEGIGARTFLPHHLSLSPPNAIDNVFGKGFSDALVELAPETWSGPVRSAHGLHLIRILEHQSSQVPPLAEIWNDVLRDWVAMKALEIREQTYQTLREQFIIKVQRDPTQSAERR